MIERVNVFRVGDKVCSTFEEAQREELNQFFAKLEDEIMPTVDLILADKEKLIDILTMTPRSRAKARKVNGATRKRKTKPTLIEHSETSA